MASVSLDIKDAKDVDRAKANKLAQSTAETIRGCKVFDTPKHVNGSRIITSMHNGERQPLNVHHCHVTLYSSWNKGGYVPTRQLPSVIVRCSKDSSKLKEEIHHNINFTAANPDLHPTIKPNDIDSSYIAASHTTNLIRMCQQGMV